MQKKHAWDKKLGLGREKIFEVRRSHNDITFIDEFFTEDFCERQQLFTYKYNPRTGRNEIETRDFQTVKTKLLQQLTNFGQPVVEVVDSNHGNRGELMLKHVHHGADLDGSFAGETLKNIHFLWKRPVNLVTTSEGQEIFYSFDGKEVRTSGQQK